MPLFNPYKRIHGVDISDKMIRLVEAHYTKHGITIDAFSEVPIDEKIISEGSIVDHEKASINLKKLYEVVHGHISSPFVVVAVPERKTFTKIVSIEQLPEDELEDAIQFEAEQHFPVSLEDMYLAWSLLETKKDKQSILLSATDKSVIEQYNVLFESIGNTIIAAEPETFAVKRALVPSSQQTILIMDLGKSKTTLSIVSRGTIRYTTTLQFSGSTLTSAIADNLHLTEEQAERAKQLFGMNAKKSKGAVRRLLVPFFNPFFDQVHDIIDYYHTTFDESDALSTIVICGGGSQMEGIVEFIESQLKISVVTETFPIYNLHKINKEFMSSSPLSFTTALGLALRGEVQKPFDLIQ